LLLIGANAGLRNANNIAKINNEKAFPTNIKPRAKRKPKDVGATLPV
jgi:hypothetical protein